MGGAGGEGRRTHLEGPQARQRGLNRGGVGSTVPPRALEGSLWKQRGGDAGRSPEGRRRERKRGL